MSPAITSPQPLLYFIHDDFDALRIEISGSLIGTAAKKMYDAWRRVASIVRRQPLVVDISYVKETDEQGRAVLQTWQAQGARIIAAPPDRTA